MLAMQCSSCAHAGAGMRCAARGAQFVFSSGAVSDNYGGLAMTGICAALEAHMHGGQCGAGAVAQARTPQLGPPTSPCAPPGQLHMPPHF